MQKSYVQCLVAFVLGVSLSVVCIVIINQPLWAQSTYGGITGTVTDSSAAAVSGAEVTLTNLGTAEKRTQASGSDGLYSFVNLIPGRYRIDAQKSGFKRTTSPEVVVAVQQTLRVDLALQVGEVSQTVEVHTSAGTPLLQPETSSLGQVVEGRSANELPLNGRNVFSLVSLAPSVVMQGGTGGTITGQNPFSWGNFQIGGAFANQSVEYLDGQPLNIGYINLPVFIPTQDSIGEFKVQTNNVGPEWGKLAGGVLNLSTKGGSNEYHGEVYEFGRYKKTSANDFFSNRAGQPRPPLTQNQFGGDFGGPLLPSMKDKTFFFFSYEGFRVRQGLSFTTTVPTQAERNGDLSALGPAVPKDPKTGLVPTLQDPCNGAAQCPSSQANPSGATFAGNIIPASRINPTSLALLKLFPLPNTTGNPDGTANFTSSASGGGNQNQWVGRLDHNIGSNQHIFGRVTAWDMINLPFNPLGTGVCPDRCTELFSAQAGAAGYNYAVSPRDILNVTLSISRFAYDRSPINSGFDFTTLGWPAAFNSQVPTALRTQPTPCIVGVGAEAFCGQGLGSGIIDRNTQYNLSPSFTFIRGRHTLVAGGQLELGYDNYTQTNIASGSFGFTGQFTGNAFGDFLLGWANNPGNVANHFFGAAVVPNLTAGRQTYWATYLSDTYHVTSKLTLNLGLRYDYQGPWIERFDRQSFFNPTAINPIATITTGGITVGVPGAVELVNTPGGRGSRFNQDPNRVGVAPRIGAAYALNPKTVIRAGYGVFWIPNVASFAVNPLNDPVNSIQTQYLGSVSAGVPINTITTPWPKFIAPPGRDPSFQSALLGQSIGLATPHTNYGYTQQWNLDVQRELPAGFVLDVAYAGTKGTHLPQFSQQINQLDNRFFAQAAAQAAAQIAAGLPVSTSIQQLVPNPFFSVASPGSPLSSPQVAAGQLLRPFPEYAGVNIAGQGSYDSSYHSLQITGTRRFGNGGTLVAAYTWSKLISNTDTLTSWLEGGGVGGIQDNNNLRNERSLSSQDVPHHLTIHYVLDLPIGRNRLFLSGVDGIANKIVSGWGVDGVATFQSGFPLNFNAASNPFLGLFGAGLRPNVVPGCKTSISGSVESRLGQYFNTSCFVQPAPFTFGNEPRVDSHLRAQGILNSDFALFKTTNFGPSEKYGVQFRAEFFNMFNRPQFGPPNTSFGSSSFGVVSSQVNSPRLVQFALKFKF